MSVRRIISGGQTGADRAALLAADRLGLERGGTAPKGWLAEDGTIPEWFRAGMVECAVAGYPARTEQNIRDGHGTLILTRTGFLTGGTALTWREAGRLGKPRWAVAIGIRAGWDVEIAKVRQWLEQNLEWAKTQLSDPWCIPNLWGSPVHVAAVEAAAKKQGDAN